MISNKIQKKEGHYLKKIIENLVQRLLTPPTKQFVEPDIHLWLNILRKN